MKERNRGEWTREKDHLCSCFTSTEQGPFQYDLGETYFCFAKMKLPFPRIMVERYGVLLNRFSIDRDQEFRLLGAVHNAEIATGHFFSTASLRAALMTVKPEVSTEAWAAIGTWLEENMIDEIDHRLTGVFKTHDEWIKQERALLAKYAKHAWARVRGLPPTRWHQLHAFTNRIEMIHRADNLFLMSRPKVTERKRSGATAQVESMEAARKDIDD